MTARLAVFACGNATRGDDALGLELASRVAAARFPGVITVEDFQFQIEHVLDMQRAALALFLDAGTGGRAPISFYEASPRAWSRVPFSHALEPEDLMAVFRQATGRVAPPTFVLCVRGESFALGEGLTPIARRRRDAAWPFLRDLCLHPEASRWRGLIPALDLECDR